MEIVGSGRHHGLSGKGTEGDAANSLCQGEPVCDWTHLGCFLYDE